MDVGHVNEFTSNTLLGVRSRSSLMSTNPVLRRNEVLNEQIVSGSRWQVASTYASPSLEAISVAVPSGVILTIEPEQSSLTA